ncbi:MAG: ferritin-like domain-containing protein [Planctomycetota bacterium]|jgi:rubrerythrin
MEKFNLIEEILDFAIENEVKANMFYLELAEKVKNPVIKETLKNFAAEEVGHRTRLEAIKAGQQFKKADKVPALKIADYVVDIEPSEDMDYSDVLIVAMKKEKAAYRLYTDLAAQTDDAELRNMMLMLAQEEAKHKLRFECEYDDVVLEEN